jgi:rare lipoprotein A
MRALQHIKTCSSRIVLVLATAFSSHHTRFALSLAVLCIVLSGCAKHKQANAPVQPAKIGTTQRGEASWYGEPYNGRRAASGEIYDMEQLTAAHKTLPFQTWVEVTNLENGKRVDVRIIDRGPFVDGRIIDLSRAAAREIDLLRLGVAKVELRVIDAPKVPPSPNRDGDPPPAAGEFAVQIGAFRERDRADALRDSLLKRWPGTRVVPTTSNPPLWRVWVGENLTLDAARELETNAKPITGQAVIVTAR